MRILRKSEVVKRTGISAVSIWRQEQEGKFPKRRKIGKRAVGWFEEEIDAHIKSCPRVETVSCDEGGAK